MDSKIKNKKYKVHNQDYLIIHPHFTKLTVENGIEFYGSIVALFGDSIFNILNLSSLEFVDTTGIGILLSLKKFYKDQQRTMIFVSPSDPLKFLIKNLNLEGIFLVFDSMEALSRCRIIDKKTLCYDRF